MVCSGGTMSQLWVIAHSNIVVYKCRTQGTDGPPRMIFNSRVNDVLRACVGEMYRVEILYHTAWGGCCIRSHAVSKHHYYTFILCVQAWATSTVLRSCTRLACTPNSLGTRWTETPMRWGGGGVEAGG